MSERIPVENRYTSERYFQLVEEGILDADDRVELLDGIIVAEPPQEPEHATGTMLVADVLKAAIGSRACVRTQVPFIAGTHSVPEPDAVVVPGSLRDYSHKHPTTAFLVVETSNTSLPQDRITKQRIYASAGVPEYWILNLRDGVVEIYRSPQPEVGYAERTIAHRGEMIGMLNFPDVRIRVDDILPSPRPTY